MQETDSFLTLRSAVAKKKDSFRLKATWPNRLSLKLDQNENIRSIEYDNLVYEKFRPEYSKKRIKSCTRQARNVNPIRTKAIKTSSGFWV